MEKPHFLILHDRFVIVYNDFGWALQFPWRAEATSHSVLVPPAVISRTAVEHSMDGASLIACKKYLCGMHSQAPALAALHFQLGFSQAEEL